MVHSFIPCHSDQISKVWNKVKNKIKDPTGPGPKEE